MCPSTPSARSRNGCRPRTRDRRPVNIASSADAWDANRSDRSRTISTIRATTTSDGSAANIFGRVGCTCTSPRPASANAVATHRARALLVLWHQLRSPLLVLLLAAALASSFVGERSDAVIIGVIVALSVGLGFVNEYRAERAAEALHAQIHHDVVVLRDGQPTTVDVTALVAGDVVQLRLGDIVPADVRLIEAYILKQAAKGHAVELEQKSR